jgi:hypothetical protein
VAKPNGEDPKKRHLGLWRPTEQGCDFVDRKISVPKKLFFYANQVVGASQDRIYITDALGSKFDYEELMAEALDFRRG